MKKKAKVKKCVACKRVKPVDKFNVDSSTADNLNVRCKVCTKKYHKRWYNKKKLALEAARFKECPTCGRSKEAQDRFDAVNGVETHVCDNRLHMGIFEIRREDLIGILMGKRKLVNGFPGDAAMFGLMVDNEFNMIRIRFSSLKFPKRPSETSMLPSYRVDTYEDKKKKC